MDLIDIFKAIGDETRIRIINLLLNGELCVCEIEAILCINQSNASRHLNKLKGSGIIECEKKAQWVYYKLNDNFKKEYNLLYNFLEVEMEKNLKCKKDTDKLKKLKEMKITCKDLTGGYNISEIFK